MKGIKAIPFIASILILLSMGAADVEADSFEKQVLLNSGEVAYLSFRVNDLDSYVNINLAVISGPNVDIVTLDESNLTNFQAGDYFYYIYGTERDINIFQNSLYLYPGTYYLVIDNTYLEGGFPSDETAVVDLTLFGENCTFVDLGVRTQANFYTYDNERKQGSNFFDLLNYLFFALFVLFVVFRIYWSFLKKRKRQDADEPRATYQQGEEIEPTVRYPQAEEIDPTVRYRPGEEHHENIGGPVVITICRHCGVQIPSNSRVCFRCNKRQ